MQAFELCFADFQDRYDEWVVLHYDYLKQCLEDANDNQDEAELQACHDNYARLMAGEDAALRDGHSLCESAYLSDDGFATEMKLKNPRYEIFIENSGSRYLDLSFQPQEQDILFRLRQAAELTGCILSGEGD